MATDKETNYPYSRQDLIESPNTYFYAKYGGAAFLTAWKNDRKQISLEPAKSSASPLPLETWRRQSGGAPELAFPALASDLMRYLYWEAWAGRVNSPIMKNFVKRFEVTKRIFDSYEEKLIATKGSLFSDLDRYLEASELFLNAYQKSGGLDYLNCALKVNDILVGSRNRFNEAQHLQAATLISVELAAVGQIAEKIGVPL